MNSYGVGMRATSYLATTTELMGRLGEVMVLQFNIAVENGGDNIGKELKPKHRP